MAEEASGTPLSVRTRRIGLSRRVCQTSPLVRLYQEELGPTTPTDHAQETPRAQTLLTNYRKRIGLSRIRTELTKKRLEFTPVSEHKENEVTTNANENKPPEKENKLEKNERTGNSKRQDDETGQLEEDKERIEQDDGVVDEVEPQDGKKQDDEKGKTVEDQEETEKETEEEDEVEPQDSRIPELQADIETWRTGFIATVNDLQAKLNPRPTKKDMLMQQGIPPEMMRYLEED